ncbi:MAG: tetratricopeptide repeat protein [Chloroflexi bacterium]|nr:tetratricopeptide repeat protein [Chloroflexota bacterium]
MNRPLSRPLFHKQRARSEPYRVLVLLLLLVAGLFVLRAVDQDQIRSPFDPTPVPTRTGFSWATEAQTQFQAGNLVMAIQAYQSALELEPNNAEMWAELSRIQSYRSTQLTTDAEKREQLLAAIESADRAVAADDFNSNAHAARAFALDWFSNPNLSGADSERYLTEAEQEAVRAIQLDNQNALALAYYAEILNDQMKWTQASQYIAQALERDSTLMDVHRVNAGIQETLANYGEAINEYKRATEITPNLTFLYLNIGVNYRQLQQYERALEYFAKATSINEQLGVNDPTPYIAIGKTYSQVGEFFIAARNVRKALQLNPTNPDVYGSLGIIYFKSRNYEGAIEALKCAVRGCDAQETCNVRMGTTCEESEVDPQFTIEGMPLSGSTVVYYYTYGSALAGMARPYNDYCTEARALMNEVRAQFSSEPAVMQIVEENEAVCNQFATYP